LERKVKEGKLATSRLGLARKVLAKLGMVRNWPEGNGKEFTWNGKGGV